MFVIYEISFTFSELRSCFVALSLPEFLSCSSCVPFRLAGYVPALVLGSSLLSLRSEEVLPPDVYIKSCELFLFIVSRISTGSLILALRLGEDVFF